jgi:hypothetical protein
MNAFEQHGIEHLSASQINTWLAAPSMWVLERLLHKRGKVGCAAHRGTAVEEGLSAGLFDHSLPASRCIEIAEDRYRGLTAFSLDPKRESEGAGIPGMVNQALSLRERGVPIRPNAGDHQHRVEIRLDGVSVPVIGFLDFMYADEIVDLKTTFRVPSSMSAGHLRQATIYKTAHMDRRLRFFYVSDKKTNLITLTRDEYDAALVELTQAARRLERFLSLSTDAQELAAIVPHDPSTFYFNDPETRSHAVEAFGY